MRSVPKVARFAHGAIVALVLGVSAPAAGAIGDAPGEQPPLPPGTRLRIGLEDDNDAMGVSHPRTDDLYTQGGRISVRWAAGGGPDGTRELGVVLGQEIYTPTQGNLDTTNLSALRHDRPYAGWLYAAMLLRWDTPDSPSLRLGADGVGQGDRTVEAMATVGVTGRVSGAADVQDGFHSLVRKWSGNPSSPLSPAGWGVYQTATQGTFDTALRAQLDVVQAAALLGDFTAQTGSVLAARLSPRARLDVGSSYDAAALGLELRAGLLAPRWDWRRPPLPFALWGYARADGRYVLHNTFIDGQLRHAITPLVALQPWVADLSVGLVLRLGPLEVGFAQLWRTPEFTPRPIGGRGMHQIGQVTAAWIH